MPSRKAKSIVDAAAPAEGAALNVTELIARRAYEFYESRGSSPGDELMDWLTAEREVLASIASLASEAGSAIDPEVAVPAAPRKKGSKATSTVSSRKKTSSTTTRSTPKPKGAHP